MVLLFRCTLLNIFGSDTVGYQMVSFVYSTQNVFILVFKRHFTYNFFTLKEMVSIENQSNSAKRWRTKPWKEIFFHFWFFFIREYLGRQIDILEIFAFVQGPMIAC